MKAFTKRLRRQIHIRASDPAIEDADWVLSLDERGVSFHRLGCRAERWGLTWRSVIGVALVHNKRTDPDPPAGGPAPAKRGRKARHKNKEIE